jgi:hypothetical protein
VAGSFKYGDEPSGSGATELVSYNYRKALYIDGEVCNGEQVS